MDDNILVIGIAGGTGSGKTTLMNNLISALRAWSRSSATTITISATTT